MRKVKYQTSLLDRVSFMIYHSELIDKIESTCDKKEKRKLIKKFCSDARGVLGYSAGTNDGDIYTTMWRLKNSFSNRLSKIKNKFSERQTKIDEIKALEEHVEALKKEVGIL